MAPSSDPRPPSPWRPTPCRRRGRWCVPSAAPEVAGDDAGRKGCRNRGIEHAAKLRGFRDGHGRSPLAQTSVRELAGGLDDRLPLGDLGCQMGVHRGRRRLLDRDRRSAKLGSARLPWGPAVRSAARQRARGSPAACRPARTGHARPSSRSPRGRIPQLAGREARRSARTGVTEVALDRVRANLRDRVGGLVAHGVEHATRRSVIAGPVPL